MKKLLALSLAGVLTLAGCAASPAASQPTITVTADAPTQKATTAPKPPTNTEDTFIFLMESVGTPSYMLYGDALDILIDQARTTCGYIADGDTKEDITWIITVAASQSGVSDEIVDAFLAASVAATYSYCPQYEGFWD